MWMILLINLNTFLRRVPTLFILSSSQYILKIFIPRRESARGPIEYPFHFSCIGTGSWGFKNTNVSRSFRKLVKFWSPDGSCESRTEGGPIVFTYVLFCLENDLTLWKSNYYGDHFFSGIFLFPDWMGWGGMGLDGVSKMTFNFIYTLWVFGS